MFNDGRKEKNIKEENLPNICAKKPHDEAEANEDAEIIEEEYRVFGKDPELSTNYFRTSDDVSGSEYLGSFQLFSDNYAVTEDYNDFENQDILQNQLEEYRKKYPQIEKDYSLNEFKLMENCYKYNNLVKSLKWQQGPIKSEGKNLTIDEIREMIKNERPTFAQSEKAIERGEKPVFLTDKQINEANQAYKNLGGNKFRPRLQTEKRENEIRNKEIGNQDSFATTDIDDYTKADIELMRKCSMWNFVYNEIAKIQKTPTDIDGNPLTQKQIDDEANNYIKIQKENPKEFAEMKFEAGEWGKKDFNFKENEYKGKKQYVSYEKIEFTDKSGNKITKNNKYVLENTPKNFKLNQNPDTYKDTYYTIKNRISKDNFSIIFIELKPSSN